MAKLGSPSFRIAVAQQHGDQNETFSIPFALFSRDIFQIFQNATFGDKQSRTLLKTHKTGCFLATNTAHIQNMATFYAWLDPRFSDIVNRFGEDLILGSIAPSKDSDFLFRNHCAYQSIKRRDQQSTHSSFGDRHKFQPVWLGQLCG